MSTSRCHRKFVFSKFDPAEIVWGWSAKATRTTKGHASIGTIPAFRRYIIRSSAYLPEGNTHGPLLGVPAGEQAMLETTRLTGQELLRLEAAGIALPPERFYIARQDPQYGYWVNYQFSSRLTGERPDPTNPAHHRFLIHLGHAQLHYLAAVQPGGAFYDRAIPLQHYTIGRPTHKNRPTAIYLHHTTDAVRHDGKFPANQPSQTI